jgi:hypothetical protein
MQGIHRIGQDLATKGTEMPHRWFLLTVAVAAGLAGLAAALAAEETLVKKDATYGPPAAGKWVPIAELTDEFEGPKLDAAKWYDHNPTWIGRQPALFAKSNVEVRDGKLHLAMRKEDVAGAPKGYHTFTSAAVQSKALVRYGYFEIKARAMNSHGSSAFWFYHQTPEVWTEIDVFEIGGKSPKHERVDHMNGHVFHTLADPDRHWNVGGEWQAPERLADGFHVYALEWDPDELKFLVDGACVRRQKNTHWHQPLTLNFDSETMPDWFGLPDPADLPSTFSVEYVRSWRKADGYGTDRPRVSELTFDAAEAKTQKGKTKSYRVAVASAGGMALGAGAMVVVARHGGEPRPALVHVEYDEAAFFAAATAATVEKTVTVRDHKGGSLALAFTWTKVKDFPRNNGYRAENVEVRPGGAAGATAPKEGTDSVYELPAADGQVVTVTLRY